MERPDDEAIEAQDDDGPAWLDPTEMRIWIAFLEASARLGVKLDATLKAEANLTLDDYEVLVHLTQSTDGRLRMTDLSDRLLHSQARLSQRVNRLAERGLVTREKCEVDRRGTFAVITDKGWSTIKQLAPIHVGDVRAGLIDQIEPDEREVMASVLERIANNLR